MANNRRTLETRSSTYDEGGEELELELEVKKMAESILHYRTTFPDKINTTFESLLATQRPVLPSPLSPSQMKTTDSGASDEDQNPDADQLRVLEKEDPETAEKIRLLKLKISSNIYAMPIMVKRMKEAISRIDKLDQEHVGQAM